MKRLMMVAVLAVAQAGCVAAQSDSAVQFSSALAQTGLGSSCTASSDKNVAQGRLDVSGGQNYQLAMHARNTLPAAQSSVVGSTTVNTGGASVVLTEYSYSYQVSPAISGIPADGDGVAATYAVLPAGNSDVVVYLNALGPKLLTRLNNYLQAGDPSVKVTAGWITSRTRSIRWNGSVRATRPRSECAG